MGGRIELSDCRGANSPAFRLAVLAIAIAFVLSMGVSPALAGGDAFSKSVAPFLKKHCVSCHGPEKQESRLRLDQVTGVDAGNRNLWTMVHERIAAGEMPPKDSPQPSDAERNSIAAWIVEGQRSLGVGGTRRLNRRELSAALRDVSGLPIDFSQSLPGDGAVAGFDTGADGLQEASDAVSVWLNVTRRVVDGLRFLGTHDAKTFAVNLRDLKEVRKGTDPGKTILESWKTDGVLVRGLTPTKIGMGQLLTPRSVGDRETLHITVPANASRQQILRLTLVVSAMKPFAGIPNPRLWVQIGGKDIDYAEVTGTAERPQRLVYEVHLGDLVVQGKGVSIHLSNKVEIPYAIAGFENEDRSNPKDPPPGGTGLFRPMFDRKTLPAEKQPVPHIVLEEISIEPDVVRAWPPPEWKADVGTIKDDVDSAKRLLGLWIDRAWRRPVLDAERTRYSKLYEKLRGDGMSFDEALRAAFQSVLLSAPFRYHASPADPDAVRAHHAIASRLSFMLTGGPPDAELRKLAMAKRLREPAVLDAQVDRLLADPRSDAFIRPFVMQWLEMEQPITIAQDNIQKQDFRFARYYKASMREETIAYIGRLFRENRPARELIVSDWTMMNDALAIHYGYPLIEGGELRKVTLRPDDPRGGGILGHAGLQSMLCWMGDNWVIYRGSWALRHILDHPPPPPPLEVPELNPADGKNRGKTFRQLLKQHQEDTRCAVCHKTIDPAGFAFQNFDISGRWRNVEYEHYARGELDGRISWVGVGKTRPVDVSGALPRGETFETFAEFKNLVVKNYQADMVRGILKNLLLYTTGRIPGIDDREEIAAIMREHRAKEYPLRDLLKAVVRSRAFLEQASPTVSESRSPK